MGGALATVYKRNKTYWVRFQWRAVETRRSAHTTSKAVAQKYLVQLQEECERLDRGGRPRRTYKEAYARFLCDYVPTLKPNTQRRYITTLRHFSPVLGDLYLDQITRTRLADFVTARLRAGRTGATIRRDLATLSVMCSCAVSWDYIDVNPVKQFSKRHIKESAPRTNFPTPQQVDMLIAHASPMAGRVIRLLAETGMRQGEVCGLEWQQVSISRREIRLTQTKTSSPRIVPLTDAALDTLVGTPRHMTTRYVFWHGDGSPYANFAGLFRGIARRAKFPHRCHDLRHHFASTFAQRVADLSALQAILGHKTIAMTMRYSHLMTEHLHAAMAKFQGLDGTDVGTNAVVSPPTYDADQAKITDPT